MVSIDMEEYMDKKIDIEELDHRNVHELLSSMMDERKIIEKDLPYTCKVSGHCGD